jgi:hypothetical protein
MKALAPVLALAACALGLAGCRFANPEPRVRAVREGALMDRELRSYHVVYSEHRGPVGYLKVYDVREAGGPSYRWSYVYDKAFTELGWIDQFGHAYAYHRYPEGAMPVPTEPLRVVELPTDSVQRNAMRMLGIDPATDNVSFPPASDADILAGK